MGLKISNLIASEILRNEDINARVSTIEKWVAVADICRCLHNYNAVLEITSSMNRSAIFRLKKTWLKVSKQVWAGSWRHHLLGLGWGWDPGHWTLGGHRWTEDRVRVPPRTSLLITWGQASGPQTWHWDPWVCNSPLKS